MKKWKQTAGFTLVELIVVIAILGILAGVGTVGYSGYIKKANQAADNMLLSAVNTAFSAACAESGTGARNVDSASLSIASNKKINGVVVTDSSVDGPNIETAFLKYFAGNTDTELKYYTGFSYADGIFSGSATIVGTNYAALRTLVNTLSGSLQANLNGSMFENSGELLNDIQSVTDAAKLIADNPNADLAGMLGGTFGQYLVNEGIIGNVSELNDLDSQTMANMATLMVASQVGGLNETAANELIQSWAGNNFSAGSSGFNLATRYAGVGDVSTLGSVATAYANTEALIQYLNQNLGSDNTALQTINSTFESVPNRLSTATTSGDVINVINAVNSEIMSTVGTASDAEKTAIQTQLTNYLSSPVGDTGKTQATLDAEAYVAALTTINNSSPDLKQYNDATDLYSYIASVMGSGN